jgi:alpha-mannosidase
VDRLVMALNPDHGRAPFEQPTGFWWEGPDGDRIFVWLSTHYGFGEEWGIVDGDVVLAESRIAEFIKRLDARDDYPYDVAVVHAANDNRWPTARFLDVVRHWNAVHPELPMRTATIDEALDRLSAQAHEAPVVRGEWSDWWSHGHGSTAREVAVYREARSFARSAQANLALSLLHGDGRPALAEVIGYRRGPVRLRTESEIVDDLAEVDEQLLLFGEHTWGSWETYSKPHSTFSHSHWNAKAGFAYAAYDLARDLAIEGMFRRAAVEPAGAGSGVLVVNPTERDRTEPVVVELDGTERRRLVVGAPAFGAAVVPVPPAPELCHGHELALGHFRVVVDPRRGGVVSLVDRRDGRDLVDSSAVHAFAALVVESIAPGTRHPMLDVDPKLFRPDHPGPHFEHHAAAGDTEPEIAGSDDLATITWRGAAPGVPAVTTALTVYRDLDVVDVEVELVKPERFGPESIFVTFPFAVADPQFLLETAGAVYAADAEQVPDTSKDWYSIQHAIGVTVGDRGVVWAASTRRSCNSAASTPGSGPATSTPNGGTSTAG